MPDKQTDLTSNKVASNDLSALADPQTDQTYGDARAIIDRGSIEDRLDLAEKLATSNSVDRVLVLQLARDRIEIAAPILEHSPLLREEDQLALANSGSENQGRLLAKRRGVPNSVAATLVESSSAIVTKTLANNHRCRLSPDVRARLIEKSKTQPDLQISLVLRPDFTAQEAAQVKTWASDQLTRYIDARFAFSEIDESYPCETGENAHFNLAVQCQQSSDIDASQTVNELAASGLLQPSILMKALHTKNDELFLESFAKLLNVQSESVHSFFDGYRAPRIAIACNALGINHAAFQSMYLLVRRLNDTEGAVLATEMDEAEKVYRLSAAQAHDEIRQICA